MFLTIVTPFDKKQFCVGWVEFDTPSGNFVVQEGHAPLISVLSAHSKLVYNLSDGTRHDYSISMGMIYVTRTDVTVITQ